MVMITQFLLGLTFLYRQQQEVGERLPEGLILTIRLFLIHPEILEYMTIKQVQGFIPQDL